ncbi:MAG: hypothetical protein K5695_02590 [Oscillospiraceae bacterium]|nr:hypothetical protein [Oscillospiraceae bacterium]
MNWKTIAIIAATALATAAAVFFILQKQNSKRKMRFDSTEFDDDDFMDDIACGEQCNFVDEDIVDEVKDAAEDFADTVADKAADVADAFGDAVEGVKDAVEEAAE